MSDWDLEGFTGYVNDPNAVPWTPQLEHQLAVQQGINASQGYYPTPQLDPEQMYTQAGDAAPMLNTNYLEQVARDNPFAQAIGVAPGGSGTFMPPGTYGPNDPNVANAVQAFTPLAIGARAETLGVPGMRAYNLGYNPITGGEIPKGYHLAFNPEYENPFRALQLNASNRDVYNLGRQFLGSARLEGESGLKKAMKMLALTAAIAPFGAAAGAAAGPALAGATGLGAGTAAGAAGGATTGALSATLQGADRGNLDWQNVLLGAGIGGVTGGVGGALAPAAGTVPTAGQSAASAATKAGVGALASGAAPLITGQEFDPETFLLNAAIAAGGAGATSGLTSGVSAATDLPPNVVNPFVSAATRMGTTALRNEIAPPQTGPSDAQGRDAAMRYAMMIGQPGLAQAIASGQVDWRRVLAAAQGGASRGA